MVGRCFVDYYRNVGRHIHARKSPYSAMVYALADAIDHKGVGQLDELTTLLRQEVVVLRQENRSLKFAMLGLARPYPPNKWERFEDFGDLSPN